MIRFTIRDLMVLTIAAGLAVAWGLDHQQLAHRLAEAEKWRTIAGGLEHILELRGRKVRVCEGRLWVDYQSVGFDEFEPKLGTNAPEERPLESYYSNWPRKTP